MPPFIQSHRQTQILILEILYVCLWLKFSSSSIFNKIEHFQNVFSLYYDLYFKALSLELLNP